MGQRNLQEEHPTCDNILCPIHFPASLIAFRLFKQTGFLWYVISTHELLG
jgi:hypothetical protein